MIKINLLGAPKPKRGGKRAATATTMVDMGGGGGEGINPVVMMGIAVVLGAAIVGWGYLQANSQAASIEARTKQAVTENRRLAAVKAKYDQEQKVKESYEQRVNVIDSLRKAQSGPANLLTMLGDTVNSTDAVWLVSMQDNGGSIDIKGSALSANAVANLINNLQKTGYFKSVNMTETQQDTAAKDVQTFNFNLSCEKQKS